MSTPISINDTFMVIGITLFAGGTSFLDALNAKYIHFSKPDRYSALKSIDLFESYKLIVIE